MPPDLSELWKELNRVGKENCAFVIFGQNPFLADVIESNRKNFKYCWIWYKHSAGNFLNVRKQPLRNCEELAVFYRRQCTYNPQMRKGKMQLKSKNNAGSTNYRDFKAQNYKNDIYYPAMLVDVPLDTKFKKAIHPTQKPVALLEYMIRTYTNEGETVLDCFMGSGSAGVASVNLGRDFIGIEKDDGYFDAASDNIHAAIEKVGETDVQILRGTGAGD